MKEFAKALKVHPTTVSRWKHGHMDPSVAELDRMLRLKPIKAKLEGCLYLSEDWKRHKELHEILDRLLDDSEREAEVRRYLLLQNRDVVEEDGPRFNRGAT